MNLLAPLGLFFALFIPAIVILYLLKLKRIDMPISSTLLWRMSLDDLKANTPFQKLKKNLLLFLQLLIVAILTMAVARPVLRLGGLEGQSFIVLLDRSASMSATDVKPSRLQEAKRMALELVSDMSIGDRMMVISYSDSAAVLTPFEQNKGVLRSVIRAIQPSDAQTDIEDALRNAISASKAASNPEVIIISDGRFTIPPDVPIGQLQTRYVPIGESDENVGIVDLVIRKDYAFQQNYEILVGIQNSGSTEQTVKVDLWGEGEAGHVHSATGSGAEEEHQADRKLMDARDLAMAPGTTKTIIFKDEGTFPEKIEVVINNDDSLETDNHAWAMIPKEKSIDILLVTAGNYYLQRVLNLDQRVQLAVTAPNDYTGPGDFDIVVFDAFAPPALVGGNYVFINALPPLQEWTAGEDKLEMLQVVDWNHLHPLTRYLNLDNLTITASQNVAAPGWAEVIAEARETPLIAAFQHEEIRGVVTSFDLYDSDWPMRVSYPIFFTNLVNWFGSGEGLSVFMKKTGDVLVLDPPESLTDKVRLNPPTPLEMREFTFTDTMPIYFGDTGKVGIYEYLVGNQVEKRYAINLLSPYESSIAPSPSLEIQGTTVQGDASAVESNREIWRNLALLALVVLIIEWLVYVKRAKYAF